jgi:hypothetical protein
VYVLLVAPEIDVQLPACASQCIHWYAKPVGLPVQLPGDAVSSDPSRAEPEIDGSDVFEGAAAVTPSDPAAPTNAAAVAAPAKRSVRLKRIVPSPFCDSIARHLPTDCNDEVKQA